MRKIFLLLAIILLMAIMACSGKGGDSAGSSSQGSGTVGSTGGSVEVSNQTSPIYGTKVTVPAGAVDSNVNISISYSEQLPGPIESDVVSVTKVIVLSKDSNKDFLLPVTITIPYTDSQMSTNDIPSMYYWDSTINRYLPLTITELDTTNKRITFITNHFSEFCGFSIPGLGSFTEQRDYDSNFRPDQDGFFQVNFASYYPRSATGGNCYGLASYSIWYYVYKKITKIDVNGLYSKYLDGNTNMSYDDTRAKELIARAFDDSLVQNRWDKLFAELNTIPIIPFQRSFLGLQLIQNLQMKVPSLLTITFGTTAHVLTVYRYVGNSIAGVFYIYDSNYPGTEQTFKWTALSGFYSYSKANAYPTILSYGVDSNVSEHLGGAYETLYNKAENGGWNSTESIFKTIDITSPVLTNNTATASGNNTISGFVRSGSNKDMTNLKLYYSVNATADTLSPDNETIINSDGSFSFDIGSLSLPTNSIRIMVGYKSPDNSSVLVFAGFREITLTTQAPPVSPPSTPTGFKVTAASSSQINLSWTASTGTVTGYKIYRSGTYLKSVTTTSMSDTGLSASTNYCYYVTAYNSAGESVQTSQLCDTTQSVTYTYSISGRVTLNGSGLSGVTITLTGSGSTSTITNSSGNYSFSNAANGSYTVTPYMTGYTFSPANKTANVSGVNVTVPDFVATAVSGNTITEFSTGITANADLIDITAGPDGNLWFTEGVLTQIGRITPAGVVTEFSAGISARPTYITAGPDGNLWFAERVISFSVRTSQLGRITPAGVTTEYGYSAFTSINNSIDGLGSITFGPDGNLWVSNSAGRIGQITTAGVVAAVFNVGGGGLITTGPDGNLWFTEFSVNQIGRITTTGVVTEFSTGITAGAGPNFITVGSDGNLWFTEYYGNRIGRITTAGVVTEFSTGISTGAKPSGITAGPDGNLWFTEPGVNKIGRITPAGVVTEFSTGISSGASPWASRPAPMATFGSRNLASTRLGVLPHSRSQ